MPRTLIALAVLLVAAPARALDVAVEVGLDGLVVDGGWTPVEVRCTLAADDPPLDGRVVVSRPREVVASVEAPLRVLPGQTAVARLAVPSGPGGSYDVRVVDARGLTLAEAAPAGATTVLLPDERLVVFVGPVGLPGLSEGGDRARVARLTPDRLPRDAHALDPAAAIVLKPGASGAAHVELARDPAAAAALERYVRGGGTLVLVPGDAAFWRDGPLDALAPARVDGRAEEPAGALEPVLGEAEGREPAPAVSGRGSEARPVPPTIPVFACTPRAGARVTWAGERHPLVVERALGRGRVVLVTFDLDRERVRAAPGTASFVAGLVARRPAPASVLGGADAAALLHDLLDATPPLGSGWFYGLALAAVAQLLAVSLLTGALVKRRGAWAGLVVPPAASVVLACVLLTAGALARGGPRVTTLLLEVPEPGGGALTVHAAVGLAAGRAGRFSVELPPALRPDAQPVSGFDLLRPRAARAALTLRPGRPPLVGPIDARAHGRHVLLLTGRALEGEGGLGAGPSVSARAVVVIAPGAVGAGPWPRVEVTSRDARPLDALRVLVFGPSGPRLGALGPLAPGDAATFTPELHDVAVAGEPLAPGPLEGPALAAAVLDHVARRLEAAWLRATATAPNGAPPPAPLAWVLDAQVEPGSVVRVLDEDGEPLDESSARTVRVTCVPAEGGW